MWRCSIKYHEIIRLDMYSSFKPLTFVLVKGQFLR